MASGKSWTQTWFVDLQNIGRNVSLTHTQVTGVRYLASFPLLLSQINLPTFGETRGSGVLDGGCPYYNVYTCADGRWMSVACLEPQFFRTFLRIFLEALPQEFSISGWRPSEADQHDRDAWPRLKTFMERGFGSRPRDYWANVFHGSSYSFLQSTAIV